MGPDRRGDAGGDRVSADWTTWHEARERSTTAPHGTASLALTAWLGPEAEEVPGLPGRWRLDADGAIVGDGFPTDGVDGAEVRLGAGQEHAFGDVIARRFDRDGTVALRVIDPASPNRTSIRGIDAFDYDPAWIVSGAFTPAAPAETVDVTAVDGRTSVAAVGGTIALELPTGPAELTVTRNAAGRLSAVFSDGSSNVDVYRFRFIDVPEPVDGVATVDFTRAFLPPCAFSDQYVCPTPLPGNRWTVRVEAGEKSVVRSS
jgi:uncharacterized protein (DUF1684 family)